VEETSSAPAKGPSKSGRVLGGGGGSGSGREGKASMKAFDPKVVNVAGLPMSWMSSAEVSVIESTLKALFEVYGEVKQVRTVKSFEGPLKPSAYIEFTDESSCQVRTHCILIDL